MRTEEEKRKHRCCFTGHRPEKLGVPEWKVKAALQREIKAAILEGYTVFISGMARGVDLWAAELVLELRESGAAIRLICAVPYPGVNCGGYGKDCFQRRNQWMVGYSNRVIAVYNGKRGGTRNTVEYARGCGVTVVKIPCGEGKATE